MFQGPFQLPAAIVLLLAGIVWCFFGYRLFRISLALGGLILGALIASSLFGVSDTWPMIAAAVLGGVIGAAILFLTYFLGVSLIGAALGAMIANMAFSVGERDPRVLVVIGCAVVGAALAMYLQRYVLIVGTAFIGAWLTIVGTVAIATDRSALAARDVWVVYPLDPAPGESWVPIAWIALGVVGALVQLGWTGGERGRVHRPKPRKKAPAPA